jgi:hypothetical protein
VYLKHLLTDRGLLVHDRRTAAITYLAEDVVLALIKDGRIQPIGNRRAIHELRWFGTPWKPVTLAQEAAGYKPSEARPTHYSYDWETDDNPQNCWTLLRLPKATRKIFLEVVTDCIQPFRDPKHESS